MSRLGTRRQTTKSQLWMEHTRRQNIFCSTFRTFLYWNHTMWLRLANPVIFNFLIKSYVLDLAFCPIKYQILDWRLVNKRSEEHRFNKVLFPSYNLQIAGLNKEGILLSNRIVFQGTLHKIQGMDGSSRTVLCMQMDGPSSNCSLYAEEARFGGLNQDIILGTSPMHTVRRSASRLQKAQVSH